MFPRVRFDKWMWRAWTILIVIGLLYAAIPLSKTDVLGGIVLISMIIIDSGWLVYLMRALHGSKLIPSEQPPFVAATTTWGYVWRCLCVFLFQLVIALAGITVLPLGKITYPPIWEIFFLLNSTIATWLLFSRDRKGQISLVLKAFRGY